MIICQLSDLHILSEGELLGGRLDVNTLARQAVQSINSLDPRPDAVIVTGDLTHNGNVSEMRVVREILDALSVPYFLMPGGHDQSSIFWEVFGDMSFLGSGGDIRYVINEFPVRLVIADTTTDKGGAPEFGRNRCEWLREQLSEYPTQPVLLAMHHPPFQCQIPVGAYLTDPVVEWASMLEQTVRKAGNVKLTVCGHVHRSIHSQWAGAGICVAPSTCVQSEIGLWDFARHDLPYRRKLSLVLEPPGYLVHFWNGSQFQSYPYFTEKFKSVYGPAA